MCDKIRWTELAVVGTVALLTFVNTLSCGFVWDDRAAILTNKDLRSQETSVWELFQHDFWGMNMLSEMSHKSFRPLTVFSFRINYTLGGFSPLGYHALNVVLHVMCSELVVLCGHRVLKRYNMSHAPVLAGLLFAIHPIHCDSVASVVGRADVLCTLLSLVAYLVYDSCRHESSTHWIYFTASLCCTVAATLCKELGATTLGILVAHEIYFLAQTKHFELNNPTAKANMLRFGILLCFGITAICFRVALNGPHRLYRWTAMENDISLLPFGLPRVLTTLHTHSWYLWKLFWPQYLCYDYGFKTIPIIETLDDHRNLLTVLAYLVLFLLVFISIQRIQTSPLFLLLSFGVFPFVPAANVLFPVGTIVAERLLYFPSVGFCLLLGYVIELSMTPATSKSIQTIFALLLICGAYRSIQRNTEWADESLLFESSVSVTPWSTKVLSNLSKVLLNSEPPRAAAYLERALSNMPNYSVGHLNLGLAYSGMHKQLHSMQSLLRSSEIDSSFPSYSYLGIYAFQFYAEKQRDRAYGSNSSHAFRTAKKLLDFTLSQGCTLPSLYFNRGLMAYYVENYTESIEFFEKTIQHNQRVQQRGYDLEEIVGECSVRNMLALSHEKMGLKNESLVLFERFLSEGWNCLEIYNNAALRFIDQGAYNRASDLYAKALHINPTHSGLLLNAGYLAEEMGNNVEAYTLYTKAHELDPMNTQININLNNLKQRLMSVQMEMIPPQPLPASALNN
ncbi:hypothetical protein THRCLA_00998 [Thraustotheca clavata]|uniref:dolichyl-phosphate-mannose--protein mannosyltransferase n=1 Tax=Thraustotheca clavata TaxID=74557 RepID=A0A1W0AAD1_9STRA|nr:hypothetical protein THRCLA_00998 [Thraustotheca clavata]